jgi:hypothetical protein
MLQWAVLAALAAAEIAWLVFGSRPNSADRLLGWVMVSCATLVSVTLFVASYRARISYIRRHPEKPLSPRRARLYAGIQRNMDKVDEFNRTAGPVIGINQPPWMPPAFPPPHLPKTESDDEPPNK